MFLYEHNAKGILKKMGITVPKGDVAASPQEAGEIARRLGGEAVVKVQVAVGGRGKGGGVQFVRTPEEAEQITTHLMGRSFRGKPVRTVLVEERVEITKEFYAGLIDNRNTGGPVAIISSKGGMEVEELARRYPESIVRYPFSLIDGISMFKIRQISRRAGIESTDLSGFAQSLSTLWDTYRHYDAKMVEINPLVLTNGGKLVALDAKMVVDDDAMFRHRHLNTDAEQSALNERERFAKERGYGYVEFNFQGEIACAATGAGLAMTSMDLINDIAPQALAFFLDVGGRFVGSTGDVLELADMFPNLKAILVNRYGGFGRGEIIAESIVKGLLEIRPKVPVMVHLSGSGEKGAIEYFRTWEPKIREAGVVFEWTSQTVTGKESENATKGGIDIIETPVRKVMEWAGYEFKRNPPEWFPQRTDWEGKTRHLIKEALSKRPEEEYRKLAEVE